MFKNHLNIAWRTIKKDKLFTLIKIGGFAVGIAACILIALFIRNEVSYDEHYHKKNQIYRVVMQGVLQGEVMKSTHFQLPFADALQTDFPEIIRAGKVNTIEIFGAGKRGIRLSGKQESTFEENFILADQEAFDILEINLKQGNSETALTEPKSLVISESKAEKYFPNGNALGQTIFLDNNTSKPYTITGVMENIPENSHLDFDFMLPVEDNYGSWTNQNYFTYVLVNPNTNIQELEQKMSLIVEKYIIPAQIKRGRSADFIDVLRTAEYKLQPVTDIYLKSDPKNAGWTKAWRHQVCLVVCGHSHLCIAPGYNQLHQSFHGEICK